MGSRHSSRANSWRLLIARLLNTWLATKSAPGGAGWQIVSGHHGACESIALELETCRLCHVHEEPRVVGRTDSSHPAR